MPRSEVLKWDTTQPELVVKRPPMQPKIETQPVPGFPGDSARVDVSLGLDLGLPRETLLALRRYSREAAYGKRIETTLLEPGKDGAKEIAQDQTSPVLRGYESENGDYRLSLDYERNYDVDDSLVRRSTGRYYAGIVSDETDFRIQLGGGVISENGRLVTARRVERGLRRMMKNLRIPPAQAEIILQVSRRKVYDLAAIRAQEARGLYRMLPGAIEERRDWKAGIEALHEGDRIRVGPPRPDRDRRKAAREALSAPEIVKPAAASPVL